MIMLAILLGLGAATAIACSSFLGGLASRKDASLAIALLNFLTSIPLITVLVVVYPSSRLNWTAFAWGGAAGVCQFVALCLLFKALAVGVMGVSSAVSALMAAIVPFVWATTNGERLTLMSIIGVTLALLAIVVVGRPTGGLSTKGGRWLIIAASSGLFLGAGFVFLAIPAGRSGLWPLLTMRVVGAAVAAATLVATRTSLRLERRNYARAGGAGASSAVGLSFFVWASHEHDVGIVSVLQALAPIGVAVLAFIVLRQRLKRHQIAALALATLSVVMFASS